MRDTPYGPGNVLNDAKHPRDKKSKVYSQRAPRRLKAPNDSINSHKSGWYTFDNDFPGQNCSGQFALAWVMLVSSHLQTHINHSYIRLR